MGKSSLAIECALRSQRGKDFERYVWVSAKKTRLTTEGIREVTPELTSLDDLMIQIVLGDEDRKVTLDSQGDLVAAALGSLRARSTLLVVDNLETVDDPDAIGSFLTNIPSPSKALLTTREDIPEGSVEVRLREFDIDATRELLRSETSAAGGKIVGQFSDSEIETIHEATGGIPLALRWVLGLLSDGGDSLHEVLHRLSGRKSEPLKFCFSNVRDKLSLDAKKVLLAFAQLTPQGSEELASELAEVSGRSFDRALDKLRTFSLLNRDEQTRSYTLLPLTRDFVETEIAPGLVANLGDYKRRAIDLCVAFHVLRPLATLVEELARCGGSPTAGPEVRRLELRARTLYREGKIREAAEVARGILESDSKSLTAAWVRSRSLEDLGQNEDAAQAYRVLCELDSGNPHNWIHLSIVLRESRNFGESLKAIQRAIVLDPLNVIGNHSLAMLYARMGRVKDARFQFERTLEIAPDNKPTLQAWATLESNAGNNSTAEKLFGKAFYTKRNLSKRDRVHNATVGDAFARHLERRGFISEALEKVAIGLTFDPDNRALLRLNDRLRRRTGATSWGQEGIGKSIRHRPKTPR